MKRCSGLRWSPASRSLSTSSSSHPRRTSADPGASVRAARATTAPDPMRPDAACASVYPLSPLPPPSAAPRASMPALGDPFARRTGASRWSRPSWIWSRGRPPKRGPTPGSRPAGTPLAVEGGALVCLAAFRRRAARLESTPPASRVPLPHANPAGLGCLALAARAPRRADRSRRSAPPPRVGQSAHAVLAYVLSWSSLTLRGARKKGVGGLPSLVTGTELAVPEEADPNAYEGLMILRPHRL